MDDHPIIQSQRTLAQAKQNLAKKAKAKHELDQETGMKRVQSRQNIEDLKSLKRKADDDKKDVVNKKAKVQSVEKKLEAAKKELDAKEKDLEKTKDSVSELETTQKEANERILSNDRTLEKMERQMTDFRKTIDEVQGTLMDNLASAQQTFDTWKIDFFLRDSRSLRYPVITSNTPEPVRPHATWRQNYGMLQRLNSPLYLTDRLGKIVKALDGERSSFVAAHYSDAELCALVTSMESDQLTGAARKVSVAIELAQRIATRVAELQRTMAYTERPAMSKAIEELVGEFKEKTHKVFKGKDEAKYKSLFKAWRRSGIIFQALVDFYGDRNILMLLPLAELLKLCGNQQVKDLPKHFLQWFVYTVTDQHNGSAEGEPARPEAPLIKFLRELNTLIGTFIDATETGFTFNPEYTFDKFTNKLQSFREQHGLPGRLNDDGIHPMSISDEEQWEMTASLSDFDIQACPMLFVKSATGRDVWVPQPHETFNEIVGSSMQGDPENREMVDIDMSSTTLETVMSLFSPTNLWDRGVAWVVMQEGQMNMFLRDAKTTPEFRRIVALVEGKHGWTVAVARKGNNQDEITDVETYSYDLDRITPAHILKILELEEGNVEVVDVDVAQPYNRRSGFNAFCHAMALIALDHRWLTEINSSEIRELRHLLIRQYVKACVVAYQSMANPDHVPGQPDDQDPGQPDDQDPADG